MRFLRLCEPVAVNLLQDFHAQIDAQRAAVQANVVIGGVPELLAGIEVIISNFMI